MACNSLPIGRRNLLKMVAGSFSLLVGAAAPKEKKQILSNAISPKIQNAAKFVNPAKISLKGWLGKRFALNASTRLLNIEIDPLLAGYKTKPGIHPWIGEHIGKYIHAATLTWVQNRDFALKAKLDDAVNQLIDAQERDGYLGTYVPKARFGLYKDADWDVWSQKYCLIGLLTYYQYCGNEKALEAAKKCSNLLISIFPNTKSINDAGTHRGMAATSVLEPIIMLYLLTGEQKYLDFAHYIVGAMDEQNGSKIIEGLKEKKKVNQISNAKAYEMLSNFVGLVNYAKVTGNRKLIDMVEIAWNDIVDNRLYVTGTASSHEHFQNDHELPDGINDSIGETCVTTTWIQLNQALLATTAKAKYGNELEKSFYNHLTGAQNSNGNDWCYYTPLVGKKTFDKHITCCHSSGPRGIALSPLSSVFTSKIGKDEYLHINSFEILAAEHEIAGANIVVKQASGFPYSGEATIKLSLSNKAKFGIKIRNPEWASPMKSGKDSASIDGWLVIKPRIWKDKDTIDFQFNLNPKIQEKQNALEGNRYSSFGPFVLAQKISNAKDNHAIKPTQITLTENSDILKFRSNDGAEFLTFADIGNEGEDFSVWFI